VSSGVDEESWGEHIQVETEGSCNESRNEMCY
jgi:hypothetical protein